MNKEPEVIHAVVFGAIDRQWKWVSREAYVEYIRLWTKRPVRPSTSWAAVGAYVDVPAELFPPGVFPLDKTFCWKIVHPKHKGETAIEQAMDHAAGIGHALARLKDIHRTKEGCWLIMAREQVVDFLESVDGLCATIGRPATAELLRGMDAMSIHWDWAIGHLEDETSPLWNVLLERLKHDAPK